MFTLVVLGSRDLRVVQVEPQTLPIRGIVPLLIVGTDQAILLSQEQWQMLQSGGLLVLGEHTYAITTESLDNLANRMFPRLFP